MYREYRGIHQLIWVYGEYRGIHRMIWVYREYSVWLLGSLVYKVLEIEVRVMI